MTDEKDRAWAGIRPTDLPSATPTVALPQSGQITGYVAGGVTDRSVRVPRTGPIAAALALMLAGAAAAADALAGRRWIVADLVTVVLAAGGVAALRQLIRPSAGASVSRRVFTVRAVTGGEVACVFDGDAAGLTWRHADILRVTGKLRSGRFVVSRVELLATPAGPVTRTVVARGPVLDRLAWALAAVAAGYAAVLLTGVL